MAIVFVGIDLAKNVFAVHGVDEHGRPALVRPSVARAKLHSLLASLPPCSIGMEACSGAHHWARLFIAAGHTVRLIAPKFVTPYRLSGRRGKTDAADAAAICEALQRPNMRFVPVKTDTSNCTSRRYRDRRGDDPSSFSSIVLEVVRGSDASTRIRCGYVDAAAR